MLWRKQRVTVKRLHKNPSTPPLYSDLLINEQNLAAYVIVNNNRICDLYIALQKCKTNSGALSYI